MRKQIALTLLALVGILPANAQYTFTLSVSWSGNCSGYTAQMNQAIRGFQTQTINGFPTRELCEQTRAMCHQELGHIELVYYDVKTGKVIKREATNCKLNVSTTPCTGRPMAGSVGTLNALGVSQGSSFYSANTANEIQNWSEDEMERMLALNKDFQSFEAINVATGAPTFDNARSKNEYIFQSTSSAPNIGDAVFKGIPDAPLIEANTFGQANLDDVKRYLDNSQGLGVAYIANPQDLSLMLQSKFQSLTGYDINAIMNKLDKTDAEKQALADYNEYSKRMCDQMVSEIEKQMGRMDQSEGKKQIDMAIIAKDCYGDDDKGYLSMTDYKRITSNNIEDPYIKSIAEIIELCNATHDETGFNSILYINEKTGGYVLGCEGSSMPNIEIGSKYYPSMTKDEETGDMTFSLVIGGIPLSATFTNDNIKDWGLNNIIQAFGGTAAQFELAHSIGNAINALPENIRKDLDLSITGHSLGGGLASVIGLATGKPTYTYNAEGVSDKILKEWGLLEKKNMGDYNIAAYHSAGDILTIAQKTAQTIGVARDVVTGKFSNVDNHNIVAEAIGTPVNIGVKGIHQQGPMVEHFIKTNTSTQSEWERIRYSRNSILAAKQDGSIQKVDHINVIFR